MGSKRKKTEKQKDFVKKKLKVGKTAAKPDNHTDTSFTAKAISLPNQSLNKKANQNGRSSAAASAGISDVDLTHQLSLLKHHSNTTRKEVLIYIEQHLPSNSPSTYKLIIQACSPMISDESLMVRTQLVQLFNACAKARPGLLDLHIKTLILFIHSAMTNIQPPVRNSSSKFLGVLVDNAAESLVRSYFIKTLKTYFNLLAWTLVDDKKSVSLAITTSSSTGGATKKARIEHLIVLRKFLRAALFRPKVANTDSVKIDISNTSMIHPLLGKYLIQPSILRPFAPLKLFVKEMRVIAASDSVSKDVSFGSGVDEGKFTIHDLQTLSTEDLSTRRKVMQDVFLKPMVKNLTNFVKEGGEVGREANSILALIEKFKKGDVHEGSTAPSLVKEELKDDNEVRTSV